MLGSSAASAILPSSIISSRGSTSVKPSSNGYLGPPLKENRMFRPCLRRLRCQALYHVLRFTDYFFGDVMMMNIDGIHKFSSGFNVQGSMLSNMKAASCQNVEARTLKL